jgi:protein-arginine kinase activator protein McsA
MIATGVIELQLKIQELDKQTNEALANEDFERATVLAKQRRALHEELHVITSIGINELNSDS